MSLNNVVTNLTLEVYDHDGTPKIIKSVACDNDTRYVAAKLTSDGEPYYLPQDAKVAITVIRPDKVAASCDGTTFEYTYTSSSIDENTIQLTASLTGTGILGEDGVITEDTNYIYSSFAVDSSTDSHVLVTTKLGSSGRILFLQDDTVMLAYDRYDFDSSNLSLEYIAIPSGCNRIMANNYTPQNGTNIGLDVSVLRSITSVVEETVYGAYAELDEACLAVSGWVAAQLKITIGEQVLRTEVFKIKNARALDAEATDWAGEYQGYNLDEVVSTMEFLKTAVADLTGTNIDNAVDATNQYVDKRISVVGSEIHINT